MYRGRGNQHNGCSLYRLCNTGKLSFEVLGGGGDEAWMRHQEAGDVTEAADDVST